MVKWVTIEDEDVKTGNPSANDFVFIEGDLITDAGDIDWATIEGNKIKAVNIQFDVTITGTNEPIKETQTLTVDVDITNNGDGKGTRTIPLSIDGGVGEVDSQDVTLTAGQTKSITLEWQTSDGDGKSTDYIATVESDTDSDTTSVEVESIDGDGRLTIYDGRSTSDPVSTTFDFDIDQQRAPARGAKVPLSLESSDGDNGFDNIRTTTGKVIEDFDDCNSLEDYFDSGNFSKFEITGSNDCYVQEKTDETFYNIITSSVGYGFKNDVRYGTDTLLVDVYIEREFAEAAVRIEDIRILVNGPFNVVQGKRTADGIQDISIGTGWSLWEIFIK